ncbi:MAG: hypothetical protein ABIK15_02205 [Pseudomonadota bacterium]
MKNQFYLVITIMLFLLLAVSVGGMCGDLDDGMAIDDSINSYDDLGNPEQNINFIKLNAKSSAKRQQKSIDKGAIDKDSSSGSGSGAMNSVVMGAGSNVKGDIIIIDESKGDKTQVVE